ncbi:hypothetical protein AVEN_64965-1 [Araneus ventricosus]|uniref:Uncharacterized protein n=1 Tax=Araneus ventricosus TaxID=182803 RepID=A0A4Y2UXQ2_ARAVE|nr:hypothetical protein AVEN_64965-1 [Araneus ventricosus]
MNAHLPCLSGQFTGLLLVVQIPAYLLKGFPWESQITTITIEICTSANCAQKEAKYHQRKIRLDDKTAIYQMDYKSYGPDKTIITKRSRCSNNKEIYYSWCKIASSPIHTPRILIRVRPVAP